MKNEKVEKASWEHNIDTYTKGKRDSFLFWSMMIFLGVFSIIALALLINS